MWVLVCTGNTSSKPIVSFYGRKARRRRRKRLPCTIGATEKWRETQSECAHLIYHLTPMPLLAPHIMNAQGPAGPYEKLTAMCHTSRYGIVHGVGNAVYTC